ncbi:MAG: hypothetical protein E7589_03345 [Ruminococcaceae bacterium]|nr:hypothetical protein [Oscillospiraceae bacterium]
MMKNRKKAIFSAITAGVILAVILLNVAASTLTGINLWFVDNTATKYTDSFYTDDGLTPPSFYTLQASTAELLESHAIPMVESVNSNRAARGEEPIKINLIFCDDRDVWNSTDSSRYILYTALQLQKKFPDAISVSFINVELDPSLAQPYKVTSSSNIYSTNVIVEFGTEFRVLTKNAFFTFNDDNTIWAYSGEKAFCSNILSVTQAESPICCVTTNHGEQTDKIPEFLNLIEKAGYIVQLIDFEKEEIPADCRIIITYDPQEDFKGFGNLGDTGISEIDKLDKYLDGAFSYMLFVDNETPKLANLEEYLEEWGVSINRAEGENYTVRDTVRHIDKDGYSLIADYATRGTGANLTSAMRNAIYPAKVIFPNATSVSYSDSYDETVKEADETEGLPAYTYGSYYKNGVSRSMYDIFTASPSAVAEIGGEQYEISTSQNIFKLMTITSETRIVQEGSSDTQGLNIPSYVAVCASTELVSDELLSSASYGNTDLMLASLRGIGREIIPVDIPFKAMAVTEIASDAYTPDGATVTAICLAVIPAAVCFGVGIYVNVKRKYL